MIRPLLSFLAALALVGCQEETAGDRPAAIAMTEDALGHYCQMTLDEHPGPKAQVHLKGMPHPLWFAQVRDAVAYLRMPEQSHAVAAVYVSDMGRAESWDAPGRDNWIPIDDAVYVMGSSAVGGMGAAELVPFYEPAAARRFAAREGGTVARLDAVPDSAVLSPDLAEDPATADYRARLESLRKEND